MDEYQRAGFGQLPVGFGFRPGIVVVDFQVCYLDPEHPLGGAPLVKRAFDNTKRLLEVARRNNIPIASCYQSYLDEREMPYWKISTVRESFHHGNLATRIHPDIYDETYDLLVCKKTPSIFFETGVTPYFIKNRVDTVIVTGCNTSGCIRATVGDSFAYRFRTIVPEDCVGDAEEQPHRDNLRDIGRRYADISDLDSCIAYIEQCGRQNMA